MMADEMTEAEAVELIFEILDGANLILSGAAMDAWLAHEFGHLPKRERQQARQQRRAGTAHHDRMRERKRETEFAVAFHVARAKRRKARAKASLRPTPGQPFRWDPYAGVATNSSNQKKLVSMGGAPCR